MVTLRRKPLDWTDRLSVAVPVLMVVSVMVVCAWHSLPVLRFCLFGAPSPGTAPRYSGPLETEGAPVYRRGGSRPPRYFVLTDAGRVEFHCGLGPWRTLCLVPDSPRPDEVYVIGYDPYWGVDYIKYPAGRDKEFVWTGHRVHETRMERLEFHFYSFLILAVLALFCIRWCRILREFLGTRRENAGPLK